MLRIGRWLQAASVFSVITLALFVLVNLAAYLIFVGMQRKGPGVHDEEWFVAPLSPAGQEILERAYGQRDLELFVSLHSHDPSIRSHPVLAFTEGLSTELYRIGSEGVRYEPDWTDQQVDRRLSRPREFVYVFGGSTGFGHGVTGDRMLTAELNRQSGEVRYLNFAVQAYDSIREVDKLLYLLRKGRRPGSVVFLDGLNDVTTFAWSDYLAHDKPRTQGLLLDNGEVGLVFGFPRRRNMLAALLFSLPVVQLAARVQVAGVPPSEPYRLRDPDRAPMNWRRLMYFYEHWDLIQEARAEELGGEVTGYFRENLDFLQRLGEAFGFSVQVVYQPIGLLDPANPFLRPAFFESRVYRIFRTVDERIRREIAAGTLNLTDCSEALVSTEGPAYIDSTHYSPEGNRLLAECVLASRPTSVEPGPVRDGKGAR